ncbi:MAG: glycosyltransferase [Egibacteraceae bacterium]
MSVPRPPLLFYSAWGLGNHNPEAERKAVALQQDWDVTYVHGVGLRNPGLHSAGKAAAGVVSRVRGSRFRGLRPNVSAELPAPVGVLASASLLVLPPRQLAALRRLNASWLTRQLHRVDGDWSAGVLWVRWPTPELVDAVERLRPAGVVYEAVDAYHLTPGVVGRWAPIHHTAERRLVALADVVVAPSAPLAGFLEQQGAANVRLLAHGVDLFDWRGPRDARSRRESPVVGFVGTIDYRIDIELLRYVATARPHWRLRLIGPVQEGFDPAKLADLENIGVEPAIAHAALGDVLAGFDVGIMPYRDDPACRYLSPVKNLEYMAAGRPAVARPIGALRGNDDLVRFGGTPHEFLEQLELALEGDDLQLARRRRAVAEANSWDRRMEDVREIAREAAGCAVRPPLAHGRA